MANKKIPFPLSSPDKTIGALVNEAVSQTLSRIAIDKEMIGAANVFLLEFTGQTLLHSFLTVDGISQYRTIVFTSATNRDLVLAIYTAFVARYSSDRDEMTALHELIARSATVHAGDSAASVVPDELVGNLSSYDDILLYLEGNTWVVILSLILMYWQQGVALSHAKS